MVRGVLRWNGGTTGGARVSQIAQVTAGTELLPIMLRVQPVLPVVRCVPVVVTTTHASRMLSGGLAQPWAHTDLLLTQRMPRPACEVYWGSRVTDLRVTDLLVSDCMFVARRRSRESCVSELRLHKSNSEPKVLCIARCVCIWEVAKVLKSS